MHARGKRTRERVRLERGRARGRGPRGARGPHARWSRASRSVVALAGHVELEAPGTRRDTHGTGGGRDSNNLYNGHGRESILSAFRLSSPRSTFSETRETRAGGGSHARRHACASSLHVCHTRLASKRLSSSNGSRCFCPRAPSSAPCVMVMISRLPCWTASSIPSRGG